MQTITDKDERATVVSIDGVEANDLISRNAMMEGLLRMEGGSDPPFVRCFYGSPSTYCRRMKWATHKTSHKGKQGSRENP